MRGEGSNRWTDWVAIDETAVSMAMPVVIVFVVARDKRIAQRSIVDVFVFLEWGRSTRITG